MSFPLDTFWSEEMQALKAETVEFASTLGGNLRERDREGTFAREDWRRCGERGILGLCVPESDGGQGQDIARAVITMEGLGHGCRDNGLTLALNAQMWTTQTAIQEFGTAAQRQRYLPRLCAGEWIAAQAMTEPDTGSDVYRLQATARKTEGGYRLNGRKILITLGPVADLYIVFATTDPQLGQWGITAFLVERTTPGLTVHPVDEKMGLRTVPLGAIDLEDCDLPAEARLGDEGAGVRITTSGLEWERGPMLASQVGILEQQLDRAVAYARERKQFGKPIGSFQSVSNRIAEMKLRLETARNLVYQVAWRKAHGKPAILESAMAKLHLGESLVASSLDAIRIHGGRGYLTETGVERDLRDGVGTVIYGGTSDIQRVIIARMLGLKA